MRYGLFVVAESDSPDAGILTTCLVSSLEEAVSILDVVAEHSGGTCVLYHVGCGNWNLSSPIWWSYNGCMVIS